jgi:hypothetical protein
MAAMTDAAEERSGNVREALTAQLVMVHAVLGADMRRNDGAQRDSTPARMATETASGRRSNIRPMSMKPASNEGSSWGIAPYLLSTVGTSSRSTR